MVLGHGTGFDFGHLGRDLIGHDPATSHRLHVGPSQEREDGEQPDEFDGGKHFDQEYTMQRLGKKWPKIAFPFPNF